MISAVNIQHIESLNEDVKRITGIDVQERIPDNVLRLADEVVNIDLTSEDLIARLKEGKIYTPDKIQTALTLSLIHISEPTRLELESRIQS